MSRLDQEMSQCTSKSRSSIRVQGSLGKREHRQCVIMMVYGWFRCHQNRWSKHCLHRLPRKIGSAGYEVDAAPATMCQAWKSIFTDKGRKGPKQI